MVAIRLPMVASGIALIAAVLPGTAQTVGGSIVVGEACQMGLKCERPAMRRVTRADLGDRWPFTVEEAVVACYRPFKAAGQIVVVGGHVFAANGLTSGMGRRFGLTIDVAGVRMSPRPFDTDDPVVDRLWATRPKPKDWPPGEPWGVRVDWSVMIREAKALGCDQ